MSLEYRLSTDSPLLRKGVFQRITSRSLRSDTFDPELEIELIRNGFEDLLRIDDPEEHAPFSLMHIDEYLALLSFPGVVWLVSNYVHLEPKQTALVILSGMPWPLWDNQERQDILLSVSMAQATFLKKVFKPTSQLIPILLSLPPVTSLAPRSHAQSIWRGIARMSNQEIRLIENVAKALRVYLHYLGGYILQCAFSEMKERNSTAE
ncbi:MAG: hypothetical protein BVN29_18480 [Nitrospira sp. ST-bin5]|nr:MAG: hypothetical protein BVN29_18480 [Nitrospira sp. ST-bin5]